MKRYFDSQGGRGNRLGFFSALKKSTISLKKIFVIHQEAK
jgi:hypothetical protein